MLVQGYYGIASSFGLSWVETGFNMRLTVVRSINKRNAT